MSGENAARSRLSASIQNTPTPTPPSKFNLRPRTKRAVFPNPKSESLQTVTAKRVSLRSKKKSLIISKISDRELKCPKCPKLFLSPSQLMCHMARHSSVRAFPCATCDATFKYSSDLRRHERITEGCRPVETKPRPNKKIVVKIARFSASVGKHTSISTGNTGPNKCPHCGKHFRKPYMLRAHIVVHTKEKPFQCPKCDCAYSYSTGLSKHMATHPGYVQRRFNCPKCFKVFKNQSQFQYHMTSHSNLRAFKCLKCDKTFKYSFHLRRHEHISESCGLRAEKNDKSRNEFKPVSCAYCLKRFRKPFELRKHMAVHTKEKAYQCKKCMKSFGFPDSLQRHSKKHTANDYQCTKCKLKFIMRPDLKKHDCVPSIISVSSVRAKGQNPDPETATVYRKQTESYQKPPEKKATRSSLRKKMAFPCPHCGKSFRYDHQLDAHIVVHTGEARFKCTYCEQSFVWSMQLYRHVRRNHPGRAVKAIDQRKLLEVLKTSSSSSSPIEVTKLTVAKAVQHLCKICGWDFVSEASLHRHSLTHLNDNSFPCLLCDLSFSSGPRLARHAVDFHGDLDTSDDDDDSSNFKPLESPDNCDSNSKPLQSHASCSSDDEDANSKALDASFGDDLDSKPFPFMASSFPEIREMYNCNYCGKHFFRHEPLVKHLQAHPEASHKYFPTKYHDHKPPSAEIYDDMETDDLTDKYQFSSQKSISVDQDYANGKYECHICGKILSELRNLRNHIKLHTGERAYQCDIGNCDSSFVTRSELKTHKLRKLHTIKKEPNYLKFLLI